MPAKNIPLAELPDGDFLDYYREPKPRREPTRREKPKWRPKIVDGWPDEVPVFIEELELYELHLGEELDRILGITT